MSRDKQIEEMAKDLCDIDCKGMKCDVCDSYGCEYRIQAEALYNAGYRKASDLAEEIFAEIDKRLDDITIVMGALDSLRTFHKTIEKVTAEVDELKKKYIGKDTNVTTKESESENEI